MIQITNKEAPVCKNCGSTNEVIFTANVVWNFDNQCFIVADVMDQGHACNICGEQDAFEWKTFTPKELKNLEKISLLNLS